MSDADDLFDIDFGMMRMPAIEVGHHGNAGVVHARLASQLGLGDIGHADDACTPGAKEL